MVNVPYRSTTAVRSPVVRRAKLQQTSTGRDRVLHFYGSAIWNKWPLSAPRDKNLSVNKCGGRGKLISLDNDERHPAPPSGVGAAKP